MLWAFESDAVIVAFVWYLCLSFVFDFSVQLSQLAQYVTQTTHLAFRRERRK